MIIIETKRLFQIDIYIMQCLHEAPNPEHEFFLILLDLVIIIAINNNLGFC